jgi:uncharacterized membrane protein
LYLFSFFEIIIFDVSIAPFGYFSFNALAISYLVLESLANETSGKNTQAVSDIFSYTKLITKNLDKLNYNLRT